MSREDIIRCDGCNKIIGEPAEVLSFYSSRIAKMIKISYTCFPSTSPDLCDECFATVLEEGAEYTRGGVSSGQ